MLQMDLGPNASAEDVGETFKCRAMPESSGGGEVLTAQPLPTVAHCIAHVAPMLGAASAAHSTRKQTNALPR